jgi:hypothetical protein
VERGEVGDVVEEAGEDDCDDLSTLILLTGVPWGDRKEKKGKEGEQERKCDAEGRGCTYSNSPTHTPAAHS